MHHETSLLERDGGAFTTLPQGRVLYRHADVEPFVVLRHDRLKLFYLIEDGWSSRTPAVGPFDPNDVLRAWRLTNVRIPDGCERGPWQWGTGFFRAAALPHPGHEWSAYETSWLPPSVSPYLASDVDRVVNESCCAAPHDEPRVTWNDPPASLDLIHLRTLATDRFPDVVGDAAGVLKQEWNAHPAGSLVLAKETRLCETFVVIDLPPTA